ncbi:MAG: immunoglobulin domain-containing protein, partial [Dehalococcoidia bacterium]|nr:immunoglobulin domain-containing protein [Dehalococcoidia bacterium]
MTTSSEDFSSVDRNATRWGTQDFLWGAGRLIQDSGKLRYYTQGVPTNNNDATRGWHVQALPYSQDWAVQVDVNLPALSMGTNSALTLNLGIVSSDDPKNHASMALERRREDANATMHFIGHMGLSDTTVLDANGSTTSTNATVRLRWDAAAQTLYYEYDANGSAALRDPASPHYTDFSGFASKVLNAGESDWKMNASSSFLVSLGGFSHGLNIAQSDGVSFDNFKIATLPKIMTQPLPQTVSLDGNATFSVTATGDNLSYQWQKDGANLATATSATYIITGAKSGDTGTYRCVVSNTDASVTSNGAVLTVITPPSITSQPANVVLVGSNTTATFSVTVTPGYGTTLSYRWQKNGVDIGGATSATYTITDANSTHVGTYTCVVTNAGGAIVTSSTATLSFFSGTVIESFGNTSLLYNSQGYYLGSLSTPLTYGGTHLSPNSFAGYTVMAVEKVGGEYRALWKTPNGYWIEHVGLNGSHKGFGPTFGMAQLRDQEEIFAQDFNNDGVIGVMPVITGQPEHALGVTGGAVHTLKVVALDASSYQWQRNGVDISGATSATYSISGCGLDDEGVSRCVISSSAGSVKSGQVYRFLKLAAG